MDAPDPSRWRLLSPRLDELLDLPPEERALRLAAWRAEDPGLADELQRMLARLGELEQDAFLQAPALPPPVAMSGHAVGPYTLEDEIGRGGMGSVWRARRHDGRYEGVVAVKFLQAGLLGGGDLRRFEREGHILARLDHPHIARLLDAGVTAEHGTPYLVLEYVEGRPIDRYCREEALELRARLRLFLDVADAVTHAHNRLILHRDLKPSNILVTSAGEVKLLDFGVAKLLDEAAPPADATRQGAQAFTPQYAAPEQLQGVEVTTATDVYALGVLLYLLLTGQHPVEARTQAPLDQMRAVVEQVPRVPSATLARSAEPAQRRLAPALRGDLDTVVAKALKKLPAQRYANAAELAEDLRRHLADQPIAARPDHWAYRGGKFVRRNAPFVSAGTLAALALLVGAGLAWREAREARQQQEQAESLIEFMLGDLRRRLEPVGRLDALDSVGDRALAYYDAQNPSRLDAASLGRQARAYHLIGEIATRRGELPRAIEAFRSAAASTGALLERHPDDPQRLFDHAQSQYWVGYTARQHGNLATAETYFLAYRELALRLVQLAPEEPNWRIEQAYAEQNLAVLLRDAGRFADARRAFEAAGAIWLRLAPQRPPLALEVAQNLGFQSNVAEALGDGASALRLQREKLDWLARAPGAAEDRQVQYLQANGQHEIARLLAANGDLPGALAAAGTAVARFGMLRAAEPDHLDWLTQAGLAACQLAELELQSGDPAAARRRLAALQPDLARLLASDARAVMWTVVLQAWALKVQAEAADAATLPGALAALAAFVDAQLREPARVAPVPRLRRALAGAALTHGDLLASAGDAARARERWAAAEALLGEVPADGSDAAGLLLRAHAQLRRGAVEEAQGVAAKLSAAGVRSPQLAALQRRIADARRVQFP